MTFLLAAVVATAAAQIALVVAAAGALSPNVRGGNLQPATVRARASR